MQTYAPHNRLRFTCVLRLLGPLKYVFVLQCRALQCAGWERDAELVTAVATASKDLLDAYIAEVGSYARFMCVCMYVSMYVYVCMCMLRMYVCLGTTMRPFCFRDPLEA